MHKPKQLKISKTLLVGIFTLFLQMNFYGQSETVVNHKGTLISVNNNQVISSATAPTDPLPGDVWFDTSVNLTRIYDGTSWLAINNLYVSDGTLTNNRAVDANSNSLSFNNVDGGYNIIGGTTGVGETAPNSSDGALLHIQQETGWSGLGPWALYVEGYSFLNGFRINAADGIRSLYTRQPQLGFATEGNDLITFTQNSNDTRLSILPNGILQFHEYGAGTITGTPTSIIGVESDGRLINQELVSNDADNSLTQSPTDFGAYYESPIKAFGKISGAGGVIRATTGVTATRLSVGRYRINLPTTAVSDDDYIIQLTQPGRGGAGNDDPGISYTNQTATSFEVIIGDNDNGGTDRSRFDSEFMFTILDL